MVRCGHAALFEIRSLQPAGWLQIALPWPTSAERIDEAPEHIRSPENGYGRLVCEVIGNDLCRNSKRELIIET